jgi:hypothetical protein
MKKYVLLFVLASFVFSASGQANKRLRAFTEDSETFLEELNGFMLASPSEEGKKLMKEFSKQWKKGTFSGEKQQAIYDISNQMLKKRKRPTHFESMLYAVVAFANSEKFQGEFANWSDAVMQMLKKSATSKQMKFFAFSKDLFESNILLRNRSVSWQVSAPSYQFMMDSVPFLKFTQPITLECHARGDTMQIRHTEGRYYPLNGRWKGKGGMVDWSKAGFSLAEVYAELSSYRIQMRSPSYSADTVRFYNSLLFDDKALIGSLQDKLVERKKDEVATYPKFDSYNKKILLSQLIENVDFIGGYSLHGDRFIASGGEREAAQLVFYRNEQKFLVAASNRIAINNNRVMASDAAVKILFGQDSILHPGLSLRFDQDERTLDLIRDGQGISAAPYLNTYHDLEMDFQVLKWKTDEDHLVFGTMPNNTAEPASFESSEFYTNNRFDGLLGIDQVHPLVRIKNFMNDQGFEDEFLAEHFVNAAKLPSDQAKRFLMWMSAEGFLIYNTNTGVVKVKDRVYRYLEAKAKKRDYDVINFVSNKPRENKNAVLDLNSMDLTMFGVDNVFVSNVRDVIAVPRNQQIVVKEGRDFSMSGRLIAGEGGRFRINSEAINFDYDDFRMYFTDASTEIWIPNNKGLLDEKGKLVLERLESEITIANGELLVDTNINKSGIWKEDYPEYPIIRSYDHSKVYYDRQEILSGVYDRERFYFDVDPFEIDSLDTYTRESLSFPGEFFSADILPNFRQELRVQDDNALGFVINTPEGGYPLYVDKGHFTAGNEIRLNKSGLRGSGQLDYLTSVTQSDDYVFYPDSMNTHANTFELARTNADYAFPQVSGVQVYEHWRPYQDVMTVYNEADELVMYETQGMLDGRVHLRPDGLTGGGLMTLEDSELESALYTFNLNDFNADTADFRLNRSDLDAIAFSSVNLQTEIDLIARTGTFLSNGTGSYVNFPENQYICYIDQLKWYMDQSHVELGASEGGAGSKFVSVHPDQDSLRFVSTSAFYNLEDYIIKASGVKEIVVADTEIYPNNGKVTVATNAYMHPLDSAELLVNRFERYHKLYEGSITVHGRNSYTGEATINYQGRGVDEQSIRLTKLYVEEEQTIGEGLIPEEMNFSFNPQFGFQGSVRLEGTQENLYYEGGYQVRHECALIPKDWVQFKAYVGAEKMELPINETIWSADSVELVVGPIMAQDDVYPSFLSPKSDERDRVMMPVTGLLSYEPSKAQFVIKNDEDSLGNIFTMSNSGCVMKGEGKLNLGVDLGQVQLSQHGKMDYNAMSNTLKVKAMIGFDFFMADKAMLQMGEELVNDPMADELEMRETYYIPNFNKILGSSDYTFEYEMYGEFEKLPSALNKSLYFYELDLEWKPESATFLSKGMLGLGNVQKSQVNKLYKGYVELAKDQSGDNMNIYLETDIGDWYYFSYANELMLSRSSLDDYNLQILEVKTSQKVLPVKKGETPYQYDLASDEDVDNFKKRFFR